MLRALNRQQVVKVLEDSYFGIDNYSIAFPQDGKNLFRVEFIPNSLFVFAAKAPDSDGTTHCWEAPAITFTKGEIFVAKDFPSILGRLRAWSERVKEEVISANPFSRELSELKDEVDRKIAEMHEDLDGFFTKDEAEALRAKLSAFESRLSDLAEKNADLQATTESLTQTIADLQSAIGSVNRGTWFRMSASRMFTGLKAVVSSKEGREFALEAAKKLLLDGPK